MGFIRTFSFYKYNFNYVPAGAVKKCCMKNVLIYQKRTSHRKKGGKEI
jgi:hypothetical protein